MTSGRPAGVFGSCLALLWSADVMWCSNHAMLAIEVSQSCLLWCHPWVSCHCVKKAVVVSRVVLGSSHMVVDREDHMEL